MIYCPDRQPFAFLKAKHQYLFKLSSHNYPDQFWVEVFAYRLGKLLDIPVPPAFVAYDSAQGISGALIEWFYRYPSEVARQSQWKERLSIHENRSWILRFLMRIIAKSFGTDPDTFGLKAGSERYIPGGDIMQRMMPNYDRKKGRQHNFLYISAWFKVLSKSPDVNYSQDWVECWSKMLMFDALIGNTDRHQDNWGIVWTWRPKEKPIPRLTPAFDNGTSMGHEIFGKNFFKFDDPSYLERYLLKGKHHMKWYRSDAQSMGHLELLRLLIELYPPARDHMGEALRKFRVEDVRNILLDLTKYSVPVALSSNRAEFMLKLIECRHGLIQRTLEN